MSTALDSEQGLTGQEMLRRNRQNGPIDLEHLNRQALGDPGLTDEVLRLYDTMSRVYLDRIEASTTVPGLIEQLQTLKSAAAGIGAWGVRDLARTAEDELRLGLPVNPERIDDIAMAVEECSVYIGGLLSVDAG